eukprot:143474-Rhodomonas_salina.3
MHAAFWEQDRRAVQRAESAAFAAPAQPVPAIHQLETFTHSHDVHRPRIMRGQLELARTTPRRMITGGRVAAPC